MTPNVGYTKAQPERHLLQRLSEKANIQVFVMKSPMTGQPLTVTQVRRIFHASRKRNNRDKETNSEQLLPET